MQAVSNTGRSGVLVLKVDEDDVNTVLMNTDIENDGSLKYAYDNFADAFSENILEYAFAYADIPRNQITKKQREAAQSLLKLHEIEKLRYYLEDDVPEEDWEPAFLRWYEKKGVLGEIVLHMFLKEFKNTIPLISKMYFKDSFSQEAKGFDAVHVSQDSLTLWLGETKFYKAWKTKGVVKGGIDELVEDLKKHITKDYLSEQYVIIKRGLETQLEHPQREEWIEKLSRPILLKDVFQYIRIPLLCIYEDDIALDYLKAIDDAVKDAGIVSHTATLRDYYNSINTFPYREQVQTVLILMPIEAKKKLVKCMLEKIWHMPSVANVIGTDLSRYKLISKGLFACNPMHIGRDERLPIALYEKANPAIVSPAYFMFEIIDHDILNEEYLMMWFRRPEFDRECWFMTDGSVRGGITWDDLCRIKLPVPSYARQCEIVESYRTITDRIALKRAENDNLAA